MKRVRVLFIAAFVGCCGIVSAHSAVSMADPMPRDTPTPLPDDTLTIELEQPEPGSNNQVRTGDDSFTVNIEQLPTPRSFNLEVPVQGIDFCLSTLNNQVYQSPHWEDGVYDIQHPLIDGSYFPIAGSGTGCFHVDMSPGPRQVDLLIYSVQFFSRPNPVRLGVIYFNKQGSY